MGYKLAGFDVIGFNEIDPKMAKCYIKNHNPKYSFIEPIQIFKNRDDLPKELYNLDILDGSPPCSSFSIAGNREKDWGKNKKFREGQKEQVLDTLFFDFIDLAKRLQPKIIVAENVKGLLLGKAKKYVTKILNEFNNAGYKVTYKLLNASLMGVPQKRERVFFIAVRNDLKYETIDLFGNEPFIDLEFNYNRIIFKEIKSDINNENLSPKIKLLWRNRVEKDFDMSCTSNRLFGKLNSFFSYNYIKDYSVCNTIVAKDCNVLYSDARYLCDGELLKIGSFPTDYNFLNNKVCYLVGMSVPPVMMANIVDRIYNQWLKK